MNGWHIIILRILIGPIVLIGSSNGVLAAMDVATLQQQLSEGKTAEVREQLESALARDSENPYLLYNRAITACLEGRFEEALIDFDLVEEGRSKILAAKARFQKGNAEFRLGQRSLTNDLESVIAHWKQSIGNYEALLVQEPDHAAAQTNRMVVRKLLLDTLLKRGQENLEKGQQPSSPADRRIQSLRSALEQFHDAGGMKPEEPQAREAKEGEEKARELLAQLLAKEGTRKTLANNMIMPRPNDIPMGRPDTPQISEGVNMLEDAAALKPEDSNIAQQLDQGRDRLADALTHEALLYLTIAPRIPRVDDQLGALRMALEMTEKALDQRPNHQFAQQVQEQIKQKLAQIHEQEGDKLANQPEGAPLEEQAQELSRALDHFQQASGLQPLRENLPKKAAQTQKRLEEALERLGDQLMTKPGEQEAPEAEVTRLEGAEQAL